MSMSILNYCQSKTAYAMCVQDVLSIHVIFGVGTEGCGFLVAETIYVTSRLLMYCTRGDISFECASQ